MTLATIFDLMNVFLSGLLAGIEFVMHYGLRGTTDTLDEQSQLKFRQALVLRLRVLVPAFFVPTAILGITMTFLNSSAPGFGYRCVALAALFIWALIRVVGTVPINSATLTWHLNAPPQNWQAQVNQAERFHNVGVWAAVIAFAFFLTAVALNLAAHAH